MTKPDSFPARVRVSMFPDKVLEVSEAEWLNLSAQGLLVDTEPTKPGPSPSQNKE